MFFKILDYLENETNIVSFILLYYFLTSIYNMLHPFFILQFNHK